MNEHGSACSSLLLVSTFLSWKLKHRTLSEELAPRLAEAGWRVTTTSAKFSRAARLLDVVRTVWQRRDDYEVANVDVFSGAAFFWAEAACWTLRRAGRPYMLTLRGGNLPQFARHHPGRVARLLNSAVVVTAPSSYLIEQLLPYRADVELLPNPLNVDQYRYRLRDRPRPKLVWLRAFRDIYNPALAPRSVALLVPEFPEIELTMYGHDKEDGSLNETRRTARQLGVENRLSLPGGVPKAEVPAALDGGDVFINTTNVDNTPVSVLEAMASGMCVVSTNVGGVPYMLEHEHDALLVPPDDSLAMAAAVQRVLTEPGLAARLSQNARSKAAALDWSELLPRWEALLRRVVVEDRMRRGNKF